MSQTIYYFSGQFFCAHFSVILLAR